MVTERRLIDANRLRAIFDPNVMRYFNSEVIQMAIDEAPTVDAVEVVHGRWMGGYKNRKGKWLYTKPCCSVCSFEQEGISNYCPNCGAKMDLEV